MHYLQSKKLLLALFALSALFMMPTESRADVVGVCTDVPGQSGAGGCDKRVNITGNVVTITLTNTSPAANGGFITADAFNLTAGTVVNSATSSDPDFAFSQGVISASPFADRNALFSTGGGFEGGGTASLGIGVGQTATFTLTLQSLNGNTESSIFTSEFIRFRGFTDGTSDKTMVQVTTTPPPTAVPEPTTMLLLGSGLAGVAARMRRRRKGESE